jgi:hypothetical protein
VGGPGLDFEIRVFLAENISKKEHPHRDLSTTLRFGRDDKVEGRYGPQQRSRDGQTAGPSTALRSGRDDKGERSSFQDSCCRLDSCPAISSPVNAVLPFVSSTGAYPDFLFRAASNAHVCGSPQREPHADPQRHGSRQEIRGAQWRDLRFFPQAPLGMEITTLPFGSKPEYKEQRENHTHLKNRERPLIPEVPAQGKLHHYRRRCNQHPELIDDPRK